MSITDLALGRRTTILVICLIIVIAGMSSYMTLPRESAPDIEFPYMTVVTPYEGASPADIESLITYPIERKLTNLSDVEEMMSTSSEGLSIIFLEFDPSVDIDTALQKVRDKVDEAKADLPDDLLDDPAVNEVSASEEWPVVIVNVSGDVGLVRLKDIAEDLEDDIENVSGVLDAEVLGGLEREIRIEFDPDRVAAYGLTMGEIIQTVSNNNLNTPGGSIDIGEAKYSFKVPTEFETPDEIFSLVAAVRDGSPIYLRDIALIRDTFKDRESFSRIDGVEGVSVKVTKRSGENLLEIANEVKAIVADYRENLPDGISLTITSDGSRDVKMMVSDLENNIISGLILVLLVMLFALGFRNAVLVAMAIPFSMLISFFVLHSLGITLNMVVLFSLILALGMLVDNAIVIIENIYRHHFEEGRSVIEAASVGTSEVAWPVIASTATTVVAFAPLVAWPGIMGQFMSYLPKTVIIVLISSLFVALVINPVLASLFIKARKHSGGGPEGESTSEDAADGDGAAAKRKAEETERDREASLGIVVSIYRSLLVFALRYRALTVVFYMSLLYLAIYAYGQSGLGVELFPDTEPNRIVVEIEAPEGTNVWRTREFALRAEEVVRKYGNIEHVTTNIGEGSTGPGAGSNHARLNVDMVLREERLAESDDGLVYYKNSNDTMAAIRAELVPLLVGVEVVVDKEKEGPPTGPPVNVEVTGDEYAMLARLAERLRDDIRDVPGVVDLTDDYYTGLPEINIRVDKEKAALLGLNSYLIGQLIKASVNGIKVGDYREGEDEYDITARLPEDFRRNLDDIIRLRVPTPGGVPVPLTSVAEIEMDSGLSSIKHIDANRVISVSSNVAAGYNSAAVLERVQHIARNGRSLIRVGDVRDPAAFASALAGASPAAEAIRESDAFTTMSQSILDAGGVPSNKALARLVADVNNAMESVDLSGIAPNGFEALYKAPPSVGALVEANRGRLDALWPEALAPAPPSLVMPAGYNLRYTGENEEAEESQAFMTSAFITALLLITLVLVTQFNSVLTPFLILASVILSFIGVFLGLIVTRQAFGIIMTGMGVISLAGVVVNNAIVLIDYTNLLRARGQHVYEAIINAGTTRFRPVLLTAVTTVLSLVPMAVGVSYDFRNFEWQVGSDSSQWWGSMATAVIFGLIVATALTLFVIPCLYSGLSDLQAWLRGEARELKPEAVSGRHADADGESPEAGQQDDSPRPGHPAGSGPFTGPDPTPATRASLRP